ncbi:LysR family transcriptional regulator [Cognatiyoonia sp. IB215182]|uniref:LysR family transcriptional regulator n=1 Tax=Cognatiyoonia sp. IB215182 TaxID=3097353 RepID=UPI002A12618A|nr:LysR family transcriptional regulator [Cognatiyoonia sp. IB215182]MDX8350996.1 LysR family transcriptional regulator [Cognatiyoonia sp. IB215182]
MKRTDLDGVLPLLAVVEHCSFRAAASALGVTPSAVSQAVKQLEERIGVPLLTRTTRSVGLTQAGRVFVDRVRPAMAEVSDTLASIREFGERPSGLLRINAPRIAYPVIFEPILPAFLDAYPDVEVEVFLDDGLADIVRDGFDAGIRLGQMVAPDMIARALTPPSRMVICASPQYLATYGTPKTPDDLAQHRCINFRRPTQKTIYHWRFVERGEDRHVPVSGAVTVNDPNAKMHAALAGLGLAYEVGPIVQPHLDRGELVQVLEDHLPDIPGFHIYYPGRAQIMLKLRVFIDFVVEALRQTKF